MPTSRDIDMEEAVDWNKKLTKNIAELVRSEIKQGMVQLRAELREQLREPLKQLAASVENNEDMVTRFEELAASVNARTASMDKLTRWATERRGLEDGRDRKYDRLAKAVERLLGDTKVDLHAKPTPPRE